MAGYLRATLSRLRGVVAVVLWTCGSNPPKSVASLPKNEARNALFREIFLCCDLSSRCWLLKERQPHYEHHHATTSNLAPFPTFQRDAKETKDDKQKALQNYHTTCGAGGAKIQGLCPTENKLLVPIIIIATISFFPKCCSSGDSSPNNTKHYYYN